MYVHKATNQDRHPEQSQQKQIPHIRNLHNLFILIFLLIYTQKFSWTLLTLVRWLGVEKSIFSGAMYRNPQFVSFLHA